MADYASKATDEAIESLERRIRKVYTQAQKDLEEKTKDFWERHRAKDVIYRQQVENGKITREDYQAWLRGQVFQGRQWDALQEQVQSILVNANKQAVSIVNDGRIDVFATNANWQAFQIEKSVGVNFGFGIYDSDTATRLLRDEPDLLPAKKLSVSKDKKWNKGNLTRQISQGIIQGEKLDDIAKRLRNVTDMNRSQSLTNARTMMTNAQNAGRQESYQRAQKMGIKVRKTWVATLDGHTRTNHRKLDGQTVDVDEPFKIGGYSIMYPGDRHAKPEMVYNCRCTMISEVVDYPSENAQRYDNVTGKRVKDMTYKEWETMKNLPEFTQVGIGKCKTVNQVEDVMNASRSFTTECSLTGCDLDSAKSVASSYQQMVERFPQLKGKIGGVQSKDLGSRTYAQCYLYGNKRVEVNTGSGFYSKWSKVVEAYERDVLVGWHPPGTTAESIVVHELGHVVDGLISDARGSWGFKNTKNGTIINKSFANELRAKVCMSTGIRIKDIKYVVSEYASQNAQEWFAECFAEYITSASPGKMASKFGEMLEKELSKI